MIEIIDHNDIDREGLAIAIDKAFVGIPRRINPIRQDATTLPDLFYLTCFKNVKIDEKSIREDGSDSYTFQATCIGTFTDGTSNVKSHAETTLKCRANIVHCKNVPLCMSVDIVEWRRVGEPKVNIPGLLENTTITQNDKQD